MSIDPELVSVPKIAEWDMEKASQQQVTIHFYCSLQNLGLGKSVHLILDSYSL